MESSSPDQLQQLVQYIRTLKPGVGGPRRHCHFHRIEFFGQVLPILQAKCQICHNSGTKLGGWDASSYESVMKGGEHGPVVIAGDVTKSLLAQLLQGASGQIMPPSGGLPNEDIQVILDWIAAGAKNN